MTTQTMTADRTLHPTPERGRLTGFATLLGKEMSAWWSTRRWWLHALLWLGLMNGFMIPVYLTVQAHPEANLDLMEQLTKIFFSLGGTTVAVGAVVIGQDAVIGERQLGTAGWILSKPVSRTAFVLSKFIAQGLTLSIIAVLIQAVIAYGQIYLLTGTALPLLPYAVACGLVILNLLFYVALILLLGALFKSRAPVLLVGLGWLFATPLLVDILPSLARLIPYGLPELGVALAMGMPLAQLPLSPILLAVGWALALLAAAVWRFEREEL